MQPIISISINPSCDHHHHYSNSFSTTAAVQPLEGQQLIDLVIILLMPLLPSLLSLKSMVFYYNLLNNLHPHLLLLTWLAHSVFGNTSVNTPNSLPAWLNGEKKLPSTPPSRLKLWGQNTWSHLWRLSCSLIPTSTSSANPADAKTCPASSHFSPRVLPPS